MPLSLGVTEEAFADVSVGSHAAEAYYCHQGSCFRVFYRLSTKMRHQPRSQGLSSYRPLGREGLSSLAPGGVKMRDPGNEVDEALVLVQIKMY